MPKEFYGPLYKYVDYETAKLIIQNQTLKFSIPSSFNDPLDCYEGLMELGNAEQLSLKVVMDMYPKSDVTLQIQKHAELLKAIRSNTINFNISFREQRDKTLISCFSKSSEKLLMWSYYSDKHKGLCFCFEFGTNLIITHELALMSLEVDYPEKLAKIPFNKDEPESLKKWITTKSVKWKEEDEVRLILMNTKINGDYILIPFPKQYLKKVIFGFNIKQEQRNEIVKLVRDNFDGINIDFAEIIIDDKKFDIKEIPYRS